MGIRHIRIQCEPRGGENFIVITFQLNVLVFSVFDFGFIHNVQSRKEHYYARGFKGGFVET